MYYGMDKRGGMKFRKRTKDYKASNVIFNPETLQATSYGWWYFVKRIGGKVVFNDYRYSVSTSRHQRKVLDVMHSLGIKADLYIEAPKGLQDLNSALELYESRIKTLTSLIQKPGTRKDTNAKRADEIVHLQSKVKTLRKLIAKEARHA